MELRCYHLLKPLFKPRLILGLSVKLWMVQRLHLDRLSLIIPLELGLYSTSTPGCLVSGCLPDLRRFLHSDVYFKLFNFWDLMLEDFSLLFLQPDGLLGQHLHQAGADLLELNIEQIRELYDPSLSSLCCSLDNSPTMAAFIPTSWVSTDRPIMA